MLRKKQSRRPKEPEDGGFLKPFKSTKSGILPVSQGCRPLTRALVAPPERGTIRVGGLGTLPGGLDRQKPPNPPPPARKGGGVLAPLAHKLKRM